MEIDGHQRLLMDYVAAIGGNDPRLHSDGLVQFDLDGVPSKVRVKEGGARIRGAATIEHIDDVDAAWSWIESQPNPPTSELAAWDSGEGPVLRHVWERAIGVSLGVDDPIAAEVAAFRAAWRDGAEVAPTPSEFDWSDPRDTLAQQAWLLFADDGAWPSDDELVQQHLSGDAGVFESTWTAAKQTQVGDLLLFYFGGSRKSVNFVARAASPAFYTSDVDVVADAKVRSEQWWVFHTPMVPIEPIALSDLRSACGDQLILRGRSGKFLKPAAIDDLTFTAPDAGFQAEVDEITVRPTGRADLPDPESMTWQDAKEIAGGALKLESDVEQYIVKPLLRACLAETQLRVEAQFPIGRKRADFVVLEGDEARCVVEVKLAINDSGDWTGSPDLAQTIDYARELDCPSVLIDTQRIVLIDRGATRPSRILERATLESGFMKGGSLWDLAEHLGVLFQHRSNGHRSWRERPGEPFGAGAAAKRTVAKRRTVLGE